MKILISNKFYYNRGGDCIASIALEQLLKKKGHDVSFFSMQHPLNLHSEWESYFPSYVDFNNNQLKGKIKALLRVFGSKEVYIQFSALLDHFQPDIVHLNNIHSQLSPIIGEIAQRRGIKVIWTLHDYKLICPAYTCLRKGKVCELCIQHGTKNVLLKKCMKQSVSASALAYLENLIWNRQRLIKHTDYFISPSSFLKKLMVKGGFPESKIKVIPNFTDRQYSSLSTKKQDYYCYVGRLSEEKGLNTLIDAAKELPYKLIVIGDGPLKESFKHYDNIDFIGFKEWDEMKSIIGQAKFIVVPSEWYENNPLSIIESFHLGLPVLGANIGGIPELICPSNNGLLFEAGNKEDLKKNIQTMFNKEFNYNMISDSAKEKFSAENYYNELIKIYEQ